MRQPARQTREARQWRQHGKGRPACLSSRLLSPGPSAVELGVKPRAYGRASEGHQVVVPAIQSEEPRLYEQGHRLVLVCGELLAAVAAEGGAVVKTIGNA